MDDVSFELRVCVCDKENSAVFYPNGGISLVAWSSAIGRETCEKDESKAIVSDIDKTTGKTATRDGWRENVSIAFVFRLFENRLFSFVTDKRAR
jgi:hypothetical protein